MKNWLLGAALTLPLLGSLLVPAHADYPVDTVRLVTHSSPGAGTDVFLRQLATRLGPIMGVNFVVENITGGGGAKAMAAVAAGPKDGSLFYGSTPTYINTSLLSKPDVTYQDLQPIVNLFYDPQTIFVRSDSPYKTLVDAVEDAKARPNQVVVAVSTPGSLDRQVMEQLKTVTGAEFIVLTHEGGGDGVLSVLNGTAQVGVGEIAELRGQVDAGAMRIITTYTDDRVNVLPDVPTAKELGIEMVVNKFRGIVGARDLPPEVITAWEEGVQKLFQDPEFIAWYQAEGLQPGYLSHADAVAAREAFVKETEAFFREFGITE